MAGVDWEAVAFVVLSALEVLFSILLVTSKRLVRAAFWLACALIAIGGIYLLFRAEFVFLIQILVYAGAVPLLFVFGIMLTRRKIMEEPGMEGLDIAKALEFRHNSSPRRPPAHGPRRPLRCWQSWQPSTGHPAFRP